MFNLVDVTGNVVISGASSYQIAINMAKKLKRAYLVMDDVDERIDKVLNVLTDPNRVLTTEQHKQFTSLLQQLENIR